MKLFENPTIDVEKLNVTDIIATSCPMDCPGNEECETLVCPID